MKRILLFTIVILFSSLSAKSQCSLTNATSCQCAQSGSTDCDLLPDIKVARSPLLVSGSAGVIEYSQSGNGVNDGRLRISVSTPNIGLGPLEIRTTNVFVCGTDTTIGTAPTICPDGISYPKNLIVQRVYHKTGNAMTYYDRPAGTMTYHPQHGHMHVDNWGEYSLRKASSNPNPLSWPIYATGAKLAFCLMDYGTCSYYNGHCVNSNGQTMTNDSFPNFGLGGGSYSCSAVVQGISAGFTDIYYQNLDGMWIDLPDSICNGDYFIVVNLDPYNYFLESEESNNLMAVPITLTHQQGSVPSVTANGPTTFCQGGSVMLTSSAATNYLWSNGATTQSIIVTNSGSYSVATNTTGTCSSASAAIQVTTSALNVTAVAAPASICVQGQAQLNTTLVGDSLTLTNVTFSNNNQYFIPDNNATGVQSPISVTGINPASLTPTTFIQVDLRITHTYDADLILYLISPSGNQIMLSNKRGGNGDNFTNTIFSTNATTPISTGSAPFTGTYVPDQSFSSLTGSINGNWVLKVTDLAGADTGRIQNWSIKFNTLSPSVHNYSWTSNPAGFSSTASNPIANLSQSTSYTVTVTNPVSGCQGSAVIAVPVNNLPQVSFTGLNTSYLITDTLTTLVGIPAGGSFSGIGVNGNTFNPISAGLGGPYTITYNFTDANGCSNSSTSQTSVVCTSPLVSFTGLNNSYIITDAVTTLTGIPSGGTFSGIGVTGNTFDPISAGIGGPYIITYNYTDNFGCSNSSTSQTSVACSVPIVSITGLNSTYELSEAAATLTGSPAGGTFSGTGVTGNIFDPATAGVGGPYTITYSYTDSNGCSNSSTMQTLVTCVVPVKPGNVKATGGNTKVCPGDSKTYSITAIPGAISYLWTPPAGGIVTSGQGTITATINYTAGFTTTDSIKIAAINSCGAGVYSALRINRNSPFQPSVISGLNSSVCNTAAVAYAITSVAGMSYNWTNTNSNSTIASGQGTNAITVDYNSSYTTGTLRVTASNGCGTSTARSMQVKATPAAPIAITGSTIVCANQAGVPYSIVPVSSAVNYTWVGPTGSHVSDGVVTSSGATLVTAASSVTVNYGSSAGALKVRANNSCGFGSYKSTNIIFNCRGINSTSLTEVMLNPNPAADDVIVSFNASNETPFLIELNDILGKTLISRNGISENGENNYKLELTDIVSGVYLVRIKVGNQSNVLKLIVN